MRGAIVLAGAILLMGIPAAHAGDWCGYGARQKSLIQCGYSSINECESALGKGGMCFVNPEVARNAKGRAPAQAYLVPPTAAALVLEK
ncbi:MAG TPA: DUF3551 domain-containing protein [Xanthobacteraceae bacterium]|jgi:hypothetical protein